MFIHLHTHSAYSLAEGAIKVKDLIKRCRVMDTPAVAITDTNNLFGAMEFASTAAKEGIQPIIGCQLQIESYGHLVLLVQNETGYRNLCALVSSAHLETDEMAQPQASVDQLRRYADGLICLSGGYKGVFNNLFLEGQGADHPALVALRDIFKGRFYLELQRHGWPDEDQVEARLIDLAYAENIPLVATNDCYFLNRDMYEAHDALLCIAEGRYISEDNRRKVTQEHYFKTAADMTELFKDLPEAIENTSKIAERCSFLLQAINPLLPRFDTGEGRNEVEELRHQSKEGLKWRLENFVFQDEIPLPEGAGKEDSNPSPENSNPALLTQDWKEFLSSPSRERIAMSYIERLDYELSVIEQMGFPGYFLIVSDFIKWAKAHNIPVGPGRGSGAGSVVAWALKITDLDPLRFGLLFERFLNPERVSMPDFDVDFCQERRDEVIKYVQEKYGRDRVAQIITFGKLQARNTVRDVGRVLQMPYGQVDRLAKMIPNNPANPITLAEALEQDADLRAEIAKEETSQKLIEIAKQLEGLYRHASTHAAGVVIGDRPLTELLPLYRDPRSDMPVTQFNMKYVESTGLVKFDFLGLKTMTVIQKAVDLVNQRLEEPLDYLQIPLDDKKSFDLMARGNTVGVFQLESAGMRDAIRRMVPDRFEDIIALVSLYRPGPMDNIPTYCDRKAGKEEPDYMHPLLQPYLEETYGIMIYQEQVMQAAQALSGYSLGSADLLRRAMGKKIKEEMDKQRALFIEGAEQHNQVPREKSEEIFEQINKFAGYGFNKSHAAAYALIAYWTAYLKANYPVEFMAASMTLDSGNTDKLSVFKQDLDKQGIALLSPDVNCSWAEFTVENQAVRYALAALKGVGEGAMDILVAERDQNGVFKTLDDFAARCDPKSLNRRQLEHMAAAGAFESINKNRAQVHHAAEMILRHAAKLLQEKESGQVSLFGGESGGAEDLPPLPQVRDWTPLERLEKEFEAVGFFLSAHPLDTKAEQLERLKIKTCAQVEDMLQNQPGVGVKMAGVLLKKMERVSQKGNKYAFLQLSDSSGVYEVTLFSETLAAARSFLEPGEALLLNVAAESREDQIRLTAQSVQKLNETLEKRTDEIHVGVSSAAPVRKLKEFLEAEGRGATQISLHVPLGDGRAAEILLPDRYILSAQSRQILQAEETVLYLREV
ncbi:MAG: DNA polymerase III subunit alpha [Rhodospirillales bacterium]|nr:DNA polymerase III subunit alpha [Rhodospirillales bacterium]